MKIKKVYYEKLKELREVGSIEVSKNIIKELEEKYEYRMEKIRKEIKISIRRNKKIRIEIRDKKEIKEIEKIISEEYLKMYIIQMII